MFSPLFTLAVPYVRGRGGSLTPYQEYPLCCCLWSNFSAFLVVIFSCSSISQSLQHPCFYITKMLCTSYFLKSRQNFRDFVGGIHDFLSSIYSLFPEAQVSVWYLCSFRDVAPWTLVQGWVLWSLEAFQPWLGWAQGSCYPNPSCRSESPNPGGCWDRAMFTCSGRFCVHTWGPEVLPSFLLVGNLPEDESRQREQRNGAGALKKGSWS